MTDQTRPFDWYRQPGREGHRIVTGRRPPVVAANPSRQAIAPRRVTPSKVPAKPSAVDSLRGSTDLPTPREPASSSAGGTKPENRTNPSNRTDYLIVKSEPHAHIFSPVAVTGSGYLEAKDEHPRTPTLKRAEPGG